MDASWRVRRSQHVAPQGRSELEIGEGSTAAFTSDMEFSDADEVSSFCCYSGHSNINMERITGDGGRDAEVRFAPFGDTLESYMRVEL